ncbi:hypothetical protein Q1W71_21995 [Flavobacterium pectinovorum]|nr:hypothetical protein [Flavobacterium pectinovorum]WKL47616.1 hypothetical protein Q1W71_21995 [Flavobacterium pectinovorum]
MKAIHNGGIVNALCKKLGIISKNTILKAIHNEEIGEKLESLVGNYK